MVTYLVLKRLVIAYDSEELIEGGGYEVPSPKYEMMFDNFRTKYGKVYNGINEESVRSADFKANADIIVATTAKNLTYSLGMIKFVDLMSDEFATTYMGLKQASLWRGLPSLGMFEYDGAEFPSSVDWMTPGLVIAVKNQGRCRSCSSFSTTGLVPLSEQQFVDGDATDSVCNRGWMDYAFAFTVKNVLCTEGSYPYTDQDENLNTEVNSGVSSEESEFVGTVIQTMMQKSVRKADKNWTDRESEDQKGFSYVVVRRGDDECAKRDMISLSATQSESYTWNTEGARTIRANDLDGDRTERRMTKMGLSIGAWAG